MRDLREQSNDDNVLSPILLFEQHTDPAIMLMLKNNFHHLVKMGYKALLWEYNPDLTLNALINLMIENLNSINALLSWLKSFGLTEEYLLKANDYQLRCALEKTPLCESEKTLFCETISEITHNRTLFAVLMLCKQHGIDYYGLDWAGTNRSSKITFEESCAQDGIRESCFAKNISQYAKQYNGGIICIMGAAHYSVQKLLIQDPILQPYVIKSFLKSDPQNLSIQIQRINGCVVNNQSDVFELGVFDYSRKTQQEIDQAFLKDLKPVIKTKFYPVTVHHFFQERILKESQGEIHKVEEMAINFK